jgi:acetyltransferase-like isoleucine patch superfamily enzyme
MGVTINLGVTIGENCKVGNSAVIKSSLPENTIIHAGAVYPPIE